MDQSLSPTRHLVLLVNRESGDGRARQLANPVLRALRSQGYLVKPRFSGSPEATRRYVAGLPRGTVVAALGGDGFFSNVAWGCELSGQVIFAPLPGGRGNDLCRALGMSMDPVQVAAQLPSYPLRYLDVAYANGRPFLGTAAIGYTGYANQAAHKAPFTTSLVYAYGAALTLLTYHPLELEVLWAEDRALPSAHPTNLDGGTPPTNFAPFRYRRREKLMMVDVGNSGRYGGGMIACPQASLHDGLLDLVMWRAPSKLRFLSLLSKAYTGRHVEDPVVSQVRSSRVRVAAVGADAGLEVPVFCDGDWVGNLPVEFRVRVGVLPTLAPRW